jgi:hypothetical protein
LLFKQKELMEGYVEGYYTRKPIVLRETYIIILTYNTYLEKYYIEKGTGLKNKKEIIKEEFEEIKHVLQDNFIGIQNERDYQTEARINIIGILNKRYEHSITKGTVPDRYLAKGYKEVLEDTYIAEITYYTQKGEILGVRFKDNNNNEGETFITYEASQEITKELLTSGQILITSYIGKKVDPIEAARKSYRINSILKEQSRRLREQSEEDEYVINIESDKEDTAMQENGPHTPEGPEPETGSDDSWSNEKENNEIRKIPKEETD